MKETQILQTVMQKQVHSSAIWYRKLRSIKHSSLRTLRKVVYSEHIDEDLHC